MRGQVRDAERFPGRQPEQGERRLGPAHLAGADVLLPAADPAQPLGVLEQRGEPVGVVDPRQAIATPSYSRAIRIVSASAGAACVASAGAPCAASAGRRGCAGVPRAGLRRDDLAGKLLRLPGGQHRLAAVEQAARADRLRVQLQQVAAGQVRGPAPGRVAEPVADVLDTKVGHPPARIAHGPGEHAPGEQAVQQPENPGGLVRRRPARPGTAGCPAPGRRRRRQPRAGGGRGRRIPRAARASRSPRRPGSLRRRAAGARPRHRRASGPGAAGRHRRAVPRATRSPSRRGPPAAAVSACPDAAAASGWPRGCRTRPRRSAPCHRPARSARSPRRPRRAGPGPHSAGRWPPHCPRPRSPPRLRPGSPGARPAPVPRPAVPGG